MRAARHRFAVLALSIVVAVTAGLVVAGAEAGPPAVGDNPSSASSAFGGECAKLRAEAAKTRCYVKLLLADIEASRNPSRELPQLDAETRAAGGFIAGACHALMHIVGRKYARRHHLTLATLQRYLPRSSDPGCSAGFGHGLIMYLAPQIVKIGPRGAVHICSKLRTRMRQYTCIHGLGHAYMRVYFEYLRYALPACRALGKRQAPDCAQGAFHDYWIATTGRDSTHARTGLVTSPRTLCGAYKGQFAMACWYRVYIERPPGRAVRGASDVTFLCRGLRDVQRAGCVAAAALSAATSDPFSLARLCSHLFGNDVVNCLRAVPVEQTDRWPSMQVALIRSCSKLHPGSRRPCYEWFGKALAVVTNGAFRTRCARLHSPAARAQCRFGAARFREPLVTFA